MKKKLLTNYHTEYKTCECCGSEIEREYTTQSYLRRSYKKFPKAPWLKVQTQSWLCFAKSYYKKTNEELILKPSPILSWVRDDK